MGEERKLSRSGVLEPILRALDELEGDNPQWYGDESTVHLHMAGKPEAKITLGQLRAIRELK